MSEVIVTHEAGLFSCCVGRLMKIVEFVNSSGRYPLSIDSRAQFKLYKTNPADHEEDISKLLFCDIQPDQFTECKPISYPYNFDTQYVHYKGLDFESITPLIKNYFSPSASVARYINEIEKKYNINYNTIAAVYYRGNDKVKEISIGSYDTYFEKCREILNSDKDIRFLVQTDEMEFRDAFLAEFANSFFIEELPAISKDPTLAARDMISNSKKPEFAQRAYAAGIIVSKCKHLVTHTGNCGLWAAHFRSNAINLHQHRNGCWL